MSRARKIAPEAAVDAALILFWKHGFSQLGTRQIEAETGLTRFTLQTDYGGKKPLFLKALDSYLDRLSNGFLPRVTSHDLEPLAQWFENRVSPEMLSGFGRYGCLMLNAIAEFKGRDSEVNQRAERYFNELETCFRAALENARDQGHLSMDFDVEAKAAILTGITVSLNMVVLVGTSGASARKLAHSTARMIREWR